MKKNRFNWTVGGLEQKIFNLCLGVIVAMCVCNSVILVWYGRTLSRTLQDATERQRSSIHNISSSTMETVAKESLENFARLEAYAIELILVNANETGKVIDDHSFDGLRYDKELRNYISVLDADGKVIYCSEENSVMTVSDEDLRNSPYPELADFAQKAVAGELYTGVVTIIDNDWYISCAPIPSIGASLVTYIDADMANTSTRDMLESFDGVVDETADVLAGAQKNIRTQMILMLVLVTGAALLAAIKLGKRIVRPINKMMDEIMSFRTGKVVFDMQDEYRTGDEIEELAQAFSDVSHKTMDYLRKIKDITAEKERVGAELSVATQIQEDMLPNIFPPYPDRREFDLIASMNPAKEVGGDFYDYYMIDHDHLGVTIADVSGKGVPAALFMVISKTLLKNHALMGASPKEVLEFVNHQLCSSNRADMFVTVWIAKIQLSTGKVVAANAGHEFPAIRRANGEFELFKDKHGFVVGGMDGIPYREYTFKLEKGDSLFVYTDGVAEANNEANELFGTDRMIEALNRHRDDEISAFLPAIRKEIDTFVGTAPQFDDITMLYFKYYGPSGSTGYAERSMEFDAIIDSIPPATEFADNVLGNIGCPMKAIKQINVVIDEIISNIASYAYEEGENGKVVLRIRYATDFSSVSLMFEDSGSPYDPLAKEDPDITLSAEEREIGGLGIFITKKLMDEVSYERRDGKNILKIRKSLKASGDEKQRR